MIALCLRIKASMPSVSWMKRAYSVSPKPVALTDGGQPLTVYECSDKPSIFQLQSLCAQARMMVSV